MITIGQLASYAGVTVKAVRVYHARGLLPEPPRDASGYRRYTAEDAISLVKIRTLAEAGVPLARIRDLLTADPGAFAAAIAEIDRGLARKAAELRRSRERIAQLSGGDRLFVSDEMAAFLGRLREIGVSARGVQLERDLWILLQSVSPAQAAVWFADKRDSLADPEFQAIYREFDAAFGWPADDPRLPGLARRAHRWLAARAAGAAGAAGAGSAAQAARAAMPALDPAVTELIESSAVLSPGWERLAELGRELRTGESDPAGPSQ
jgi:DNA-binding transcriptional MerR regulator